MTDSLDPRTRHILTVLGTAALRIADGQPVTDAWLRTITIATSDTPPSERAARSHLLTVSETCERLRLSRWSVYRLIHDQQLHTVTVGRRRFVPTIEIDRFVGSLVATGGQP